MSSHNLIVLPGAGSPLSTGQGPVYDLLRECGNSRGWDVEILVYNGAGHGDPTTFPESAGSGLTQAGALAAVRDRLLAAPLGSRVLARSFGCNVILAALRDLDGLAARLDTVALWGPVSEKTYVKAFVDDPEGIETQNRTGRDKARDVVFSPEFYTTMDSTERLMAAQQRAPHLKYRLCTGTEDASSLPEFSRYLCEIAARPGVVAVEPVVGARHEVLPSDPPAVVAAFLDFVFG